MIPRLETERLVLRGLDMADTDVVQELAGAREIAANTLTIPHPYPKSAAVDFITKTREAVANGSAYVFALVPRSQTALVGVIGLHPQPEHQSAELGYWLGKPYWGQGYTTEAAQRVVQFGFEELGLNRIYASHFASNPASGRVMQKIGMTYEGTLKQHIRKWDTFQDVVCYGILRPREV